MHLARSEYTVRTDVFQGPLDLLLDLIEKRKLHISDISLAHVADDYIGYVRAQTQFPTAHAAEFLLIASTLVLIKSKSLLPNLSLTEEEEGNIEELEQRLAFYKLFKEATQQLRGQWVTAPLFGPQRVRTQQPKQFAPDPRITRANLADALQRVAQRLPKEEDVPQAVVAQVARLEDTITALMERVQSSMQTSFREFTGRDASTVASKEEKAELIVGFLAMLELVKQGIVAVRQEEHFDDIRIESSNVSYEPPETPHNDPAS